MMFDVRRCRWTLLPSIGVLSFLLAVAVVLFTGPAAFAAYPESPIRIIIPFSPGGATDVEIRHLAPQLQKHLGVPVVVENVPGAQGMEAYRRVWQAAPDGYTLLAINTPHASILEQVYDGRFETLGYSYLVGLITDYRVLVASAASPIKNFQDVVDNASLSSVTFAGTLGGSDHMAVIFLQRELGAEGVIHVPVGGSAAMRSAVLGGHVDLTTLSYSEALQWVQQGEVTAIAVLAPERLPGLPDVPSVVELGIPNVQVYTTRGLVAPPGLPEERRAILIEALRKALAEPEFVSWAESAGKDFQPRWGDEYLEQARKLAEDVAAVAPAFREAN